MIRRLLRPSIGVLALYGLICLPLLSYFVWRASFAWGFFFTAGTLIFALLAALCLGLGIAVLVDRKHHWSTHRYLLLPIMILLALWMVARPVENWQTESSQRKAQPILTALEAYHQAHGRYPAQLEDLPDAEKHGLPLRTNLGTHYRYERNEPHRYTLSFIAYGGFTAYYYSDRQQWVMAD